MTRTGTLTEPLTGRRWDADEISRQILVREAAFLADGIEPGDRVLLHFGNSLEFFAELLAVWRLGGCAIPVDARLTAFEVERLALAARARFAVVDDTTPAPAAAASGEIVRRHADDVLRARTRRSPPTSTPRLDDDALILFTSGSTGEPKGVVHTHRSLLARWTSLADHLGVDAYRRTLCLLPTHFGHGLICNALFPWLAGCDLFVLPPFRAEIVMRLGALVDEHRITFLSSVPSLWSLALRTSRPPRSDGLRRVHVGSAPLSAAVWQSIQEWSGTREVLNAYGITETGSWVAGTTGEAVVPESGLVGRPWGAEIRVAPKREDEDGPFVSLCAPAETGMIWLRTPALMRGYFERPDLTDVAVRGGWFRTGDIGFLDERGRLHLKGRERDEINKGGLKVFPADVDEIVEQHPAVRDVCSFGFEDAFYGENVGLAVVLEDRRDEVLADLHGWIGRHLAEHKHPVRWYLVDEIPRTSRGKVNRESVRRACDPLEPVDVRALLRRSGGGEAG